MLFESTLVSAGTLLVTPGEVYEQESTFRGGRDASIINPTGGGGVAVVSPAYVSLSLNSAAVLRPGGSGLDCRTLPRVLQAPTRFSLKQRNRDKQDACRREGGKQHDSGQQITQHYK